MQDIIDPVEFISSCDNVSLLKDILRTINEEIKSISNYKENPSPLAYSFAKKMKITVDEVFDRRLRIYQSQREFCETRIKELSV